MRILLVTLNRPAQNTGRIPACLLGGHPLRWGGHKSPNSKPLTSKQACLNVCVKTRVPRKILVRFYSYNHSYEASAQSPARSYSILFIQLHFTSSPPMCSEGATCTARPFQRLPNCPNTRGPLRGRSNNCPRFMRGSVARGQSRVAHRGTAQSGSAWAWRPHWPAPVALKAAVLCSLFPPEVPTLSFKHTNTSGKHRVDRERETAHKRCYRLRCRFVRNSL